MAISAYSSEGLLKKHPLLGTSFSVDPARSGLREQFRSLYPEAQQLASSGRQGMVSSLAKKYKRFGDPHSKRIGEIQDRLRALGTQSEAVTQAGDIESSSLQKRIDVAGGRSQKAYGPLNRDYFARVQNRIKGEQRMSQDRLSLQLEGIGGEQQTLAEEQIARQKRLSDRASLYNMFLGA